jgi:hypothetical protein
MCHGSTLSQRAHPLLGSAVIVLTSPVLRLALVGEGEDV